MSQGTYNRNYIAKLHQEDKFVPPEINPFVKEVYDRPSEIRGMIEKKVFFNNFDDNPRYYRL